MPCRIFEFAICGSMVRTATSTGIGPWSPTGYVSMSIQDLAETAMDEILAPYNSNETIWTTGLAGSFRRVPPPWAIIVLDREYPIAGHVSDVSDMMFGPYSRDLDATQPGFVPPVGIILVPNPEILAKVAATASPLFSAAWEGLQRQRQPPQRHWLCLLEPLSSAWVQLQAEDNTRLYHKNRPSRQQ